MIWNVNTDILKFNKDNSEFISKRVGQLIAANVFNTNINMNTFVAKLDGLKLYLNDKNNIGTYVLEKINNINTINFKVKNDISDYLMLENIPNYDESVKETLFPKSYMKLYFNGENNIDDINSLFSGLVTKILFIISS